MLLRSLVIRNDTPHTLVPYPIVTVDGQTTRRPDYDRAIPSGHEAEVDLTSKNPIFFAEGVSEGPNGLYLDLQTMGKRPRVLLRRYHFKVTPGLAGKDPALQPDLYEASGHPVTSDHAEIDIGPDFTPQWVSADAHAEA